MPFILETEGVHRCVDTTTLEGMQSQIDCGSHKRGRHGKGWKANESYGGCLTSRSGLRQEEISIRTNIYSKEILFNYSKSCYLELLQRLTVIA